MAAGGTSSEIKIIKAILPYIGHIQPVVAPPTLRPARDSEAAYNLTSIAGKRVFAHNRKVYRATLLPRPPTSGSKILAAARFHFRLRGEADVDRFVALSQSRRE
jgi:hypothetical protein